MNAGLIMVSMRIAFEILTVIVSFRLSAEVVYRAIAFDAPLRIEILVFSPTLISLETRLE